VYHHASCSYAVPIKSLEEETGIVPRMPDWTAPLPRNHEVFIVHVGLGFSSCAGFLLTTEAEPDLQQAYALHRAARRRTASSGGGSLGGGGGGGGGGGSGGDGDNDDDERDFLSPTMVALSHKSVAFGVKDFLDHVVDSPRFTAAVSTQLSQLASQNQGVRLHHSKDFVCVRASVHACMCACVRVCMRACARACICVRVRACACMRCGENGDGDGDHPATSVSRLSACAWT
jgi:hypothetical protein